MYDRKKDFCEQFGVVYTRGCEIDEKFDEEGKIIPEWEDRPIKGLDRKVRVLMDAQQYQMDTARQVREGGEDVYETFNIIVRRNAKENNFKSVLQSIRDVMSKQVSMPEWLHDVFLGYGNPAAASYRNMPDRVATLDFKDTFLSWEHLCSSFPEHTLELAGGAAAPAAPSAAKAKAKAKKTPSKKKRKTAAGAVSAGEEAATAAGAAPPPLYRLTFPKDLSDKNITVTPYMQPNRGPGVVIKKNAVPFTPVQTEAIRSGLNHGLTMVVGPPGTGKTDVAVQIVSNLYHSFPEQRTLIVTHANQALNDIFSKIMVRDIDERYLLRLGHGEKNLDTDKKFDVRGRVDFMLGQRLKQLAAVEHLGKSLGLADDVGYTCETAAHFNLFHIKSRWTAYVGELEEQPDKAVAELFPFSAFFADVPQPLFKGVRADDIEIAVRDLSLTIADRATPPHHVHVHTLSPHGS